jgi:hypothetical protein
MFCAERLKLLPQTQGKTKMRVRQPIVEMRKPNEQQHCVGFDVAHF